MPLTNVKNIILVLSGKGGVGKSSVTTQLALTLTLQGHSVGVLDVDLTGPSIPRLFGVENARVRQAPGGWIPVPVHEAQYLSARAAVANNEPDSQPTTGRVGQLLCMSLGFILPSRNDAVIWRGPKKTAMVRQFLSSVLWPRLDYLLIDTPPGTSDEHISLMETLLKETATADSSTPAPYLAGAVVVTTPQAISIADVRKELNFCRTVSLKVLGVVENMAGFVCPHCRECTNLFSKGGGQVMANDFEVPFLGSVPIDPAFVALVEEGTRPTYPEGTVIAGVDVGKSPGQTGEPPSSAAPISNGEADPAVTASDAERLGATVQDHGLLVEKYTSCSLYPVFTGIVKRLVEDVAAKRAVLPCKK